MNLHDSGFLKNEVEKNLLLDRNSPEELYAPVRYMLSLGGKRLRPVLLLMSNEMFGGDYNKVLPAALTVEMFHNFTLLHDDIMDKAPTRRAQQTVHEKWNSDTAILSGDALFVQSMRELQKCTAEKRSEVFNLFLRTALEVCEGQQLDMNFEKRNDVSLEEYISMIRLKTAMLIAASLQMGAILAGASEEEQKSVYSFGENIGIAFQLHDDLLDMYGDNKKTGKQTGGDILTNKKTFLLIKAMELADDSHRGELRNILSNKHLQSEIKVKTVKNIFDRLDVKQHAEQLISEYFSKTFSVFEKIQVEEERKKVLREYVEGMRRREE
ncbi:MAG TPA: polyprenyl synthetase family protein [Bacteroidia bacterium]|nr:polyprenyl synthetase family protein [Bacteroidia bacterium]